MTVRFLGGSCSVNDLRVTIDDLPRSILSLLCSREGVSTIRTTDLSRLTGPDRGTGTGPDRTDL